MVDKNRIFAFKLECQPPVSADTDRPVFLQHSRKAVKMPSGCIHVSGMLSIIEGKQLQPQFAGMLCLYPGFPDTRYKCQIYC